MDSFDKTPHKQAGTDDNYSQSLSWVNNKQKKDNTSNSLYTVVVKQDPNNMPKVS